MHLNKPRKPAAGKPGTPSGHVQHSQHSESGRQSGSAAGLVSLVVGGIVLAGSLLLVIFAGRVEAAQPGTGGATPLPTGLWLVWMLPVVILAMVHLGRIMLARQGLSEVEHRPSSGNPRAPESGIQANRPGTFQDVPSEVKALDAPPDLEGFLDALDRSLANGKKQSSYVGLSMVGIDDFAAITDAIGQPATRQRLQQTGLSLHSLVRSHGGIFTGPTGDIQPRYLVLLPNTDPDRAMQMAEEIRLAVEDLGYDSPAARNGIMTASQGLAVMVPSEQMNRELLCKTAQEALNRSLREGGNRIEIAMLDPQPGSPP
jgi:diguanylate cyclase (GGDEF)-like protein